MTGDYKDRLLTAQHELSHALVAYAMQCYNITVQVFHPAKRMTNGNLVQGICTYYYPVDNVVYKLFTGSAPFASPAYIMQHSDLAELKRYIDFFHNLTNQGIPSYKAFVLKPIREFMGCTPILSIINKWIAPLAEGSVIKTKTPKDFEKLFPADIDLVSLNYECKYLRQLTKEYPFPEE